MSLNLFPDAGDDFIEELRAMGIKVGQSSKPKRSVNQAELQRKVLEDLETIKDLNAKLQKM